MCGYMHIKDAEKDIQTGEIITIDPELQKMVEEHGKKDVLWTLMANFVKQY